MSELKPVTNEKKKNIWEFYEFIEFKKFWKNKKNIRSLDYNNDTTLVFSNVYCQHSNQTWVGLRIKSGLRIRTKDWISLRFNPD